MAVGRWRRWVAAMADKPAGHEPYWALEQFIVDHGTLRKICVLNGVQYRESPHSSTEMFRDPTLDQEDLGLGNV
jgi:hypothetical protein